MLEDEILCETAGQSARSTGDPRDQAVFLGRLGGWAEREGGREGGKEGEGWCWNEPLIETR